MFQLTIFYIFYIKFDRINAFNIVTKLIFDSPLCFVILKIFVQNNNIANGNEECVKETTRSKSRQQPAATNGSSIQRENPEPGGVLQPNLAGP